MTLRAYLAVFWPAESIDADRRVIGFRRVLTAAAWRERFNATGLMVWTPASSDLPVHPAPDGGGVIGHIFPRPGAPCAIDAIARGGSRRKMAQQLADNAWGGFVALLRAPFESAAIYREPTGVLDCITWSLGGGIEIAAADVDVPAGLRPRRYALDWDQIGAFVAVPTATTSLPLFDDVTTVRPGELLTLNAGAPTRERIWSAASFARSAPNDLEAVRPELVRRVDLAVDRLVDPHRKVVMELSGGLDSSILAGALGATDHVDRVTHWLNYREARREADETAYAQAVTARLGVPLTSAEKTLEALDEAAFRELGAFPRPSIGGADAGRDRFETDLLGRADATGIVSGQGGDGVFFQFPTALVAADYLRRRGAMGLASTLWPDVARRTRTSVWSVLREAWAANHGRPQQPRVITTLLSPEWAAFAPRIEHEWVTEARAEGLPVGKLLHIRGIALTHIYRMPSRRLEVADIVMPLFSQPVIELCLALPTPVLAGGSYDRPFAREAFAGRLPQAVIDRRAKGDLSAHVRRTVAASRTFLRSYLMDGCLCAAGLLDRDMLDRTLDETNLMLGIGGLAGDVLNVAAVEAWVRHWQTRVPDAPHAGR